MIFIKITNPLFTLLCIYKLIIHRRRLYGSSYKTDAFSSSLFYPFTILMHEDGILLQTFKFFLFSVWYKILSISSANSKKSEPKINPPQHLTKNRKNLNFILYLTYHDLFYKMPLLKSYSFPSIHAFRDYLRPLL